MPGVSGMKKRERNSFRPVLIPVIARAQMPLGSATLASALSDGTLQSRLYRTGPQKVLANAHGLRVGYANIYNNAGSGTGSLERDGLNTFLLHAAIEFPSGKKVGITPSDGALVKPGEMAVFDVPVAVKEDDLVYFWTQVYVDTLGKQWPLGTLKMSDSVKGVLDNPGYTNVTQSTLQSALSYGGSTSPAYGPAMVVGVANDVPSASVLLGGTSIAYGVGSTGNEQGWLNQPLIDLGIPHQNIAQSSSTTTAFADPAERKRRMAATSGVYYSDAFWEGVTNDLGFSFASFQAALVTTIQELRLHAKRVWTNTSYPHTSDAGGLTPGSNESKRVQYNTWLRDGAPFDTSTLLAAATGASGATIVRCPVYDKTATLIAAGSGVSSGHPMAGGGVVEAADCIETSRDSGVFVSGTTNDGIHPNQTGHTALKACMAPATWFRA